MADILASPPPGTWVDPDGRVYKDMDGRLSQVRRRTTWTRQEVLETLIRSEDLPNSFCPRLAVDAGTEGDRPDMPRSVADWTPAERTAACGILVETPLQDWSEYSRVLIWDRLCITLRDLDFWIAARGERRPEFLLHPAQPANKAEADRQGAIHAAAECEEWLLTLMAGAQSAPKNRYLEQAKEKWPNLTGAEFDRTWAAAAKKSGSGWARPGRRRRG